MVNPITPAEATSKKLTSIPDYVIEAFNTLIAKHYDGRSAVVKQEDVVAAIVTDGITRSMVFENHWLDVEDIFRNAGWDVEYDKPCYNESYPATFTFTSKYKTS